MIIEEYRAEPGSGKRRAIVFYIDKGSGFLIYLKWWIFAWKKIELNSEKEAFDIILFTHPLMVGLLPTECQLIPSDFDPEERSEGRCLYRELRPLSERNLKYDNYLNSQECLFNNQTSTFLGINLRLTTFN